MVLINPFVLRKYAAMIFGPLLTVMLFYIATIFYGLLIGIVFYLVGIILGAMVGNLLLKTPFSIMLEGKGLLCFNYDSTGILRPFIVSLKSPYIVGKYNKKKVQDVFDRSTVINLAAPVKNAKPAEMIVEPPKEGEPDKRGGIRIELDEKEYNKARFGLFHYPVLIWNDQIKSIITKDWLGNKEKEVFAEHGVLYLNRTMENLTSYVRDFGRYIVEVLKPKESIFKNKWVIIVIVIFLIVLAAMFAPAIINAIKGTAGTITNAAEVATQSTVTPR